MENGADIHELRSKTKVGCRVASVAGQVLTVCSPADSPSVLRAGVRARHRGAAVRAAVRALGRQGVRAARLLLHAGARLRAAARHAPRAR